MVEPSEEAGDSSSDDDADYNEDEDEDEDVDEEESDGRWLVLSFRSFENLKCLA